MKKSARGQALSERRESKGFTLVELLIVIAIIGILAAVVMLIINPLELTRRSRDAARLQDLANLQQAINVAAQEATDSGTEILCLGGLTAGFCTGDTSDAQTTPAKRKSDGTGWVKVNLSAQQSVSIPTLPVDPSNTGTLIYSYKSDGTVWEIDAKLESLQYIDKMENDGGSDTTFYETGSDLTLI